MINKQLKRIILEELKKVLKEQDTSPDPNLFKNDYLDAQTRTQLSKSFLEPKFYESLRQHLLKYGYTITDPRKLIDAIIDSGAVDCYPWRAPNGKTCFVKRGKYGDFDSQSDSSKTINAPLPQSWNPYNAVINPEPQQPSIVHENLGLMNPALVSSFKATLQSLLDDYVVIRNIDLLYDRILKSGAIAKIPAKGR